MGRVVDQNAIADQHKVEALACEMDGRSVGACRDDPSLRRASIANASDKPVVGFQFSISW